MDQDAIRESKFSQYQFADGEAPKDFDGRFELIEVATVVLENSVVLGLAKNIQENVK